MSKRRRNVARLYMDYDNAPGEFVYSVWKAGTATIHIPIILALDYVKSKRGSSWQCILAQAIKRLIKDQPHLFPHPMKVPHVKGTALYIITSGQRLRDGMYPSVRYQHNFEKRGLRKFDRYTPEKFMEEFGDKNVIVTVTVPRVHGQAGVRGVRREDAGRERNRRLSHGAYRRAVDAGLIVDAA